MPMSRRSGGSMVTSELSKEIAPPVGSSKPATQRSVVVLPQPDGPSSETSSPSATSRSMPFTAATVP